jgi:HEAT repeat protein
MALSKGLLELYSSLRQYDSDVRWSASRVIISDFIRGKKHPASVLSMAFNIMNGRAFDPQEEQSVRSVSQDEMENAIAAGIEKIATLEAVITDLKSKEPLVRVLAIENLVIACQYETDISKAIPCLEDMLADRNPGVRKNAAFAFVIMSERGYDLSRSEKALSAAKDGEDGEVSAYAERALKNSRGKRS